MGNVGDRNGSFARSLQDLKRRGSNLLVVGSLAEHVRDAATRRLLGDGVSETRRRLFVFTDATHAGAQVGNGAVGPETTRVIDRVTPTRSAAAMPSASSTAAGLTRRRVEPTQLGSLAWCIEEEIGAFDANANGLSSGELRLCFDSLAPLVSEHDVPTVLRFLRVVGNRVRASHGMAHYHLPVSRSDPIVDELASAFDAVIELRVRDGHPEHRWELRETDFVSSWIPL
ncbi:hypothetical protein SAMN04487950_2368 [Halogranum rubrum]|uniref:KaiC protein n=1 Tax=Halogranum rubrum TaxID=553466 RepID=A0A1I4ES84_9EURY|nr:hypothetical protein [Halogranum rubrum]SFL08564.1 hypothetical protein SAMN04487950_2368 [Halogranum rubrum]